MTTTPTTSTRTTLVALGDPFPGLRVWWFTLISTGRYMTHTTRRSHVKVVSWHAPAIAKFHYTDFPETSRTWKFRGSRRNGIWAYRRTPAHHFRTWFTSWQRISDDFSRFGLRITQVQQRAVHLARITWISQLVIMTFRRACARLQFTNWLCSFQSRLRTANNRAFNAKSLQFMSGTSVCAIVCRRHTTFQL